MRFIVAFGLLLFSANLGNTTELPVEKKFLSILIGNSYSNSTLHGIAKLLEQNYPHLRIVFVDTCKHQTSSQQSLDYFNNSQFEATILRSNTPLQTNQLILETIISANNDEIVYLIDENAIPTSNHLFSQLNLFYQDPNVWCLSHTLKKGRQIKKGLYFLRSFYAGLAKRIPLEYTLKLMRQYDNTIFFDFLILDIADSHAAVTNFCDVTDAHLPRRRLRRHLLEKVRIPRIDEHPSQDLLSLEHAVSDLMIFSYDRPLQLHALLSTIKQHVSHIGKISVIYRASSFEFQDAYARLSKSFDDIEFIKQSHSDARKEFKSLVLEYAFNKDRSASEYITFAVDDIIVKDKIDFSLAIRKLEECQAYGVFFRLGKHVTESYMARTHQGLPKHHFSVGDEVIVWELADGKHDWAYPNSLDFTTYRKADIEQNFREIKYSTPNELEGNWHKHANLKKLALCFSTSKIVNIPINIVSEFKSNRSNHSFSVDELLKLYNQGYQIDTTSLYQINNQSAHIDFHPRFKKI